MAPYSMADLLLAPQERVSAVWSESYHHTQETSRFILSTRGPECRTASTLPVGTSRRAAVVCVRPDSDDAVHFRLFAILCLSIPAVHAAARTMPTDFA